MRRIKNDYHALVKKEHRHHERRIVRKVLDYMTAPKNRRRDHRVDDIVKELDLELVETGVPKFRQAERKYELIRKIYHENTENQSLS